MCSGPARLATGAIPFSHSHSSGAVGLRAHDYVACGFDRADVIIGVGYDMIEYHPYLRHPYQDRKIIHVDTMPAEAYEHHVLEVGDSVERVTSTSRTRIS